MVNPPIPGLRLANGETYLWIRAVVLHEGMLDLDALLSIASSDGGVDIVQLVHGHVGVQLVRLLKLLEMLEGVHARRLSLDGSGDGRDLLRLMALAEDCWDGHGGQTACGSSMSALGSCRRCSDRRRRRRRRLASGRRLVGVGAGSRRRRRRRYRRCCSRHREGGAQVPKVERRCGRLRLQQRGGFWIFGVSRTGLARFLVDCQPPGRLGPGGQGLHRARQPWAALRGPL